jgi:hypothetical protein
VQLHTPDVGIVEQAGARRDEARAADDRPLLRGDIYRDGIRCDEGVGTLGGDNALGDEDRVALVDLSILVEVGGAGQDARIGGTVGKLRDLVDAVVGMRGASAIVLDQHAIT